MFNFWSHRQTIIVHFYIPIRPFPFVNHILMLSKINLTVFQLYTLMVFQSQLIYLLQACILSLTPYPCQHSQNIYKNSIYTPLHLLNVQTDSTDSTALLLLNSPYNVLTIDWLPLSLRVSFYFHISNVNSPFCNKNVSPFISSVEKVYIWKFNSINITPGSTTARRLFNSMVACCTVLSVYIWNGHE